MALGTVLLSTGRVNHRSGYRHRDLGTRVGTIDVAVPKLRHGVFFPDWFLERRSRAERALSTVITASTSPSCVCSLAVE